jgi:hypothetical protein
MSPRKPKEKELTLEEALALAKKELAPQWHISKPLIAGVKAGNKVNVVPLDEVFAKKDWIILFIDVTEFAGDSAAWFFKELVKRYQSFGLTPMAMIRETYQIMRDRDQATRLLDHLGMTFIHVVDRDNLLSQGFQAEESPAMIVWKQNILRVRRTRKDWFEGLEVELQSLLREMDPGLPLWLPIPESSLPYRDRGRLEFGAKGGLVYPGPGFKPNEKGFPMGQFHPHDLPMKWEHGEIFITGKWVQDQDRIATSDPDATIRVEIPHSTLGIFAQPLGEPDEHATIEIELGEVPVPDVFAGSNLVYNEEGRSVLRMSRAGLFRAMSKLPPKDRKVRFKFPYAHQTPVAIYGLRFAE